MQSVVSGQAAITLEWKKYLGKKIRQAKSSTHDIESYTVVMLALVGLGPGTAVCTGSSSLLIGLASIFASTFYRTYAQETRRIMVWKPTNCVSGEERRDSSILLQSSIPIDFEGTV